MKVLFVFSLIAAFASPAVAGLVRSQEAGKAHCTKLVVDQPLKAKEIQKIAVPKATAAAARG